MNDKLLQGRRIGFMGTPAFAVPSLAALIDAGAEVPIVITQPDKKVGRKQEVRMSAVKEYALEHDLFILQPEKVRKNEELKQQLAELNLDAMVVAAYGKIIPQSILDIPKFGCINVHGSLLPLHRGASPIQTSLLEGDDITGVTIMLMDAGMDTGDILSLHEFTIRPDETSATLYPALADLGAAALSQTLVSYFSGEIAPVKQNDDEATYTKMIAKQDGQIDWSLPAYQHYHRYQAFTPWPGIFTFLDRKRVKLLQVSPSSENSDLPTGTIEYNDEDELLHITCGERSVLAIHTVQMEGKKPMNASDFARGYQSLIGTTFDN
jgi:methionyl-tRNA formyltransferase